MDEGTGSWELEREEPLAPWMRRALLTAEEAEGLEGPTALDLALLALVAEEVDDEREEPVRGPLRRALLAIDP